MAPVATVVPQTATMVRVNFSEGMENNLALETPGNYTFASVGIGKPLFCATASAEAVSPPTYVDLTISEMTDGEPYELSIDPTVVSDVGGEPVSGVASFDGLGEEPQVSGAVALNATTIRVTFNEDMDPTDENLELATNYVVTPTEAGAASVSVQSVAKGELSDSFVDLTTSEMTDGKGYKVAVANVRDAAYNPLDLANDEASFTGVGDKPVVARVEAISANRMDVVFSESMTDNADIRDVSRYTWDQGLTTISILDVDNTTVKLVTSDQEPGVLYTLTISNP